LEFLNVLSGTIKYCNPERGFYFAAPDDGSDDVFVHAAGLARCGIPKDAVRIGTRISFEPAPSRNRPGRFEATTISLIDAAD
jgi:CspA family cold shock protein